MKFSLSSFLPPPPLDIESCQAPWFAQGGHSQTLFAYFLASEGPSEAGDRCEIPLGDGDALVARRHRPFGTSRGTVLLFHGLSGSADSNYLRRTAKLALARGWTVLRVNHRGAGEGLPMARRLYHSGVAADLGQVLAWGQAQSLPRPFVAMGFSLSGNLLLNLLGSGDKASCPDFAVAVNPSFHLHRTSQRIGQGFNRVYENNFVGELVRDLRRRQQLGLWSPEPLPLNEKARLREFDEKITAPAAGFRSADDYYSACSAWNVVNRIKTPTWVLTAEDDPLVPVEDFTTANWSHSVRLHIEKTGGHLGYLEKGLNPSAEGQRGRWLDRALARVLQHVEQIPTEIFVRSGEPRLS